jgi:hypothetical protein
MAYNIDTIHDYGNLPFVEDNTLADARGKFVVVGTDGVVTVAAEGTKADGNLRNNPKVPEVPAVTIGGFPYVLASEDLVVSDLVAVGADGGAKVATTGDAVMGKVLDGALAGEFARITMQDGDLTAS